MKTDKTVYLNGAYLPSSQARVSVLDRGFMFGDGIYEVIPVYNNNIFRLDDHLKRLENSLNNTNMTLPVSKIELLSILEEIKNKNANLGDRLILYLHITRGEDTVRRHDIAPDIKPTLYVEASALPTHDKQSLIAGKSAITTQDIRWQLCHIKSISLLANVLLNQQAKQQGAAEAILIRDGLVTEGASSNIFMVQNNIVYTPALSHSLLGGITRQLVIELAKQHAIEVREQNIQAETLYDADEIWITSTSREVFPISNVDNRTIGDGKAGELWSNMFDYFQQYTKSY